ncbi:MAG: hypothetical protein RL368_287, partial [Pseudomonadota bacterium]
DNLGKIEITGSYLIYNDKRLYPVPNFLLKKEKQIIQLTIDEKDCVECDEGKIVLPKLTERGAKPLENCWLTYSGMEKVLMGKIPCTSDLIPKETEESSDKPKNRLFVQESHTGIARNQETRVVEEGALFQTKHVRLSEDLKIGALVQSCDLAGGVTPIPLDTLIQTRFGGEGRMASVKINQQPSFEKFTILPTENTKDVVGIVIILLTPADFNQSWTPQRSECGDGRSYKRIEGFKGKPNENGITTWIGKIAEIELEIISAVIGKPIREGGWDLKNKKARAVRSLIPAGSAYFCRVLNDSVKDAINKLQGIKIGQKTFLGYGEIAVGVWK